jgi:hypothetical protein
MFRKSGIAIKSPNAFHYVPGIEFKVLFSDLEFLTLERRPPW